MIVLPPAPATARKLGIPIREAEVHRAVAALCDGLLPRRTGAPDFVIANELSLAYGRPDIVAAEVELAKWRAWRRRNISPCTAPQALATALALKQLGGSASVDALATSDDGQTSRARVRRSLASLVELGWVRRRGELFDLRLTPGEAVAGVAGVEAKLNNWRRAVRQVQSWEGLVDAAWLAFPASYMRHVPRTTPLRRFGLIAVENGEGRIVRRPSNTRANGVRHVLIEQHLFARWLATTRRTRSAEVATSSSTRGRVRGESQAG